MRIIAGFAKGFPLHSSQDLQVRPTTDRVREAIFSRISARIVNAKVLDLFAGFGGLGLEAGSRGASSVLFIEQSTPTLQVLRQNIARLEKFTQGSVLLTCLKGECFQEIKKLRKENQQFDIIFADPPYGAQSEALLKEEFLPCLLKEHGILVLESAKRIKLNIPTRWIEERTAIYGDTRVSFMGLKMIGEEP